MSKNIAAILFDFGDTLVMFPHLAANDKSASFKKIVKRMYDFLVKNGFKIEWEPFFENYRIIRLKQIEMQRQTGREYDLRERVSKTLEALGINLPPDSEIIEKALEEYLKGYERSVTIEKETYTVLEKLHSEYKLGLITNFAYPPFFHKIIEKFNLKRFFDAIVVSGEVGWAKPNPKIFHIILSKLNLKPEKCIFVGDHPEIDIMGAKNVGMKTILLSKEKSSLYADLTIRDIRELLSAINRLKIKEK